MIGRLRHAFRPVKAAPSDDQSLGTRVKRGLAWSTASALVLRMGNLLIGIALARILAPADFGVYAIALTVQSVLLALAELGMSADLVRCNDFDKRAPTVSTISITSGLVLCVLMVLTASPTASALGSAAAAPVIVVLSFTLVIASAGVTPYAKLQRNFEQRKLFATGLLDLVLSSVITVALVAMGIGPMALAIGRLVAQAAATSAQFLLARVKPRFGFDRDIASSALKYGLPLAGGNLLSWALLSVDKVAISRASGEISLGIYVLAFNVASWPMTAIGQAIRSVSLPAFAQQKATTEASGLTKTRDRGIAVGIGYAWAAALPAGLLIAALSTPLVAFLYGDKWAPSAPVLAALGLFGSLRVLFDVSATYLLAHGRSRPVLWIQLIWIAALIPAMIFSTRIAGAQGAAWAQVAVAMVVVTPVYGIYLWRAKADLRSTVGVMWLPTLACIPAYLVARLAAHFISSPFFALFVGGTVGLAVYAVFLRGWYRRLQALRASLAPSPLEDLEIVDRQQPGPSAGDPVSTDPLGTAAAIDIPADPAEAAAGPRPQSGERGTRQ